MTDRLARRGDLLAEAVRAFATARGANEVAIWRYSTVFTDLWQWSVRGADSIVPSKAVILWDQTGGDDPVATSLRDFVSPVAWALCFNHRRRRSAPKERLFPVFVIDLDGETSVRSIAGHAACLERPSWLTLISTEPNGRNPKAWADLAERLKAFLEWKQETPDDELAAGLLRNQLATFVLEGDGDTDYHHVANHLGPILLLPSETAPPVHAAVLSALDILARQRRDDTAGTGPSDQQKTPGPAVSRSIGIRAIAVDLVDDRAKRGPGGAPGWEDVLKAQIAELAHSDQGLAVSLECRTAPDDLVRQIETAFPAPVAAPGASPSGEAKLFPREQSVLFLDLRLFDENPSKELEFFEGLISVARRTLQPGVQLKWLGIVRSELERITQFLRESATDPADTNWRRDPRYLEALSLLPRLLALADFTRPIVIFSSSRQREVETLLKPYGSIVATVPKPRLDRALGAHDVRSLFKDALEVALLAAARWIEASNQFRTARQHAANPFPWECKDFAAKSVGTPVIAFYLDETGDPRTRPRVGVGGLGILYPDERSVDLVDTGLEASTIKVGEQGVPMFFGHSVTSIGKWSAKPPAFLMKRPEPAIEQAATLKAREIMSANHSAVFSFLLWADVSKRYERSAGIHESKGIQRLRASDNFICRMVRDVLETILWAVVPAITQKAGLRQPSVWLFYGSRRVTLSNAEASDLRRSLGDVVDPGGGYHSVSNDGFPRIAIDTIHDQPNSLRNVCVVERGLGVRMPYFCSHHLGHQGGPCDCGFAEEGNANSLPRQAHYFADWEVGRLFKSEGDGDKRFKFARTGAFDAWLSANRAAARGQRALAVYWAARAAEEPPVSPVWYPPAFREVVAAFLGADLVELCRLVEIGEVAGREVRASAEFPAGNPQDLGGGRSGTAPGTGSWTVRLGPFGSEAEARKASDALARLECLEAKSIRDSKGFAATASGRGWENTGRVATAIKIQFPGVDVQYRLTSERQ